ncbi:hypothetical protein [Nonomuraea sp. SYSU D8015]|uniref:hypothetical protein n=1 Tax=Nonomuraea sp. SYSU D8015 TaxID=2593644 RepID=UPI00166082B1|nr:hypothetical protein [Nonomuraea sp. SYSU D8015]
MNASLRAALVGAVVGLTQFIIVCWRGDDIGALDALGLISVPYALGFFLARWGRLPRWWGVATAGPAITAAFLIANITFLKLPTNLSLDDWQAGLAFMAVGATSYLAAGGLFMPMHLGLRALTVGGVAVAYLAVGSAHDTIMESARAYRLAHAETPLIAPTLPDHSLTYVEYSEPWLELHYQRDGRGSVYIAVGPETTATPKTACKKSLPWRDFDTEATCRQVAPGVWLHDGRLDKAVYGMSGNALVRVEGTAVTVEDLVGVLRTFRPVSAEELAKVPGN